MQLLVGAKSTLPTLVYVRNHGSMVFAIDVKAVPDKPRQAATARLRLQVYCADAVGVIDAKRGVTAEWEVVCTAQVLARALLYSARIVSGDCGQTEAAWDGELAKIKILVDQPASAIYGT